MSNKFTTLLDYIAKQTKLNPNVFEQRKLQALDWYKQKILQHFGNTSLDLTAPSNQMAFNIKPLTTLLPGHFYTFQYNPKYKHSLPYYDLFPYILLLDLVSGGFIGLNFHYLYPSDRALFMDKLYKFELTDLRTKSTMINITYDVLKTSKNYAYYKACIKRYRRSNIGHFLVPIQPQEWDIALFLPTEKFVNANKMDVWEQSRNKY